MKAVAIIPARLKSSRLEEKVLLKILNKHMIQWVYETVSSCKCFESVIVATDDNRIYEVCKSFGANVVMTKSYHKSGTDRISEVASSLDADIIVNVQGDEPLIDKKILETLVTLMKQNDFQMGTLVRSLKVGELENPNLVKALVETPGSAKYFYRDVASIPENDQNCELYAHIGIYAYRREFLLKYSGLAPSENEQVFRLEQLRAIDNGETIGIGVVEYDGIGVDTRDDLLKVEQIIREKNDRDK